MLRGQGLRPCSDISVQVPRTSSWHGVGDCRGGGRACTHHLCEGLVCCSLICRLLYFWTVASLALAVALPMCRACCYRGSKGLGRASECKFSLHTGRWSGWLRSSKYMDLLYPGPEVHPSCPRKQSWRVLQCSQATCYPCSSPP